MSAHLFHNDAPMRCCGMMEGFGFDELIPEGTKTVISIGGIKREIPTFRQPTQQDTEDRLTWLIGESSNNGRNCVMIVLSDYQTEHIAVAERLGFNKIQSFWNPNSGNNCHIMTYLHYDSNEDYNGEWD